MKKHYVEVKKDKLRMARYLYKQSDFSQADFANEIADFSLE